MNLNLIIHLASSLVSICCASFALASEVKTACSKSGIPILTLKYRDTIKNKETISNARLGDSAFAKFLKNQTLIDHPNENSKDLAASEAVKRFVPDSSLRNSFLRYASHESKMADPAGYIKTLLTAFDQLVPDDLNRRPWFMALKNSRIVSTEIRAAKAHETGDIYGAILTYDDLTAGKFNLRILVSNNSSENLPYLLTLMVHELQHAWTFLERQTSSSEKAKIALTLVDEAKAFDLQMQAYIELAKKRPEIFCNWTYVSWAYGDLIVPLSWVMASMEEEMKSGNFIADYAKQGSYASHEFLLNEDRNGLNKDVQKAITNLKLKYVR